MPPLPLACEDLGGLGHLGPGDGVGDERHDVTDLVRPQVAVHADDEIQVFDDTGGAIPADRGDVVLPEQPECARNDEIAAEPVPAQPSEEEGA